MSACHFCKNEITDSKFMLLNDIIYKSCPGCSKSAGMHVFYKCPELFGCAPTRANKSNPLGLQSHCAPCRSEKQGPHENAVLCERGWYQYNGEAIETGLYDPVTPDNIQKAIRKSKYHGYYFSYNDMRGVVQKIDDVSTGYIAYVINDEYSDIEEVRNITTGVKFIHQYLDKAYALLIDTMVDDV